MADIELVIKIPKRVYDYILKTNNIVNSDRLEVAEAIVNGTPIQTGKWNEYYTSQKGNDVFNCKECGHTFVVMQGKDNMNYCPNCGCHMVEPQESEE